MRKSLALAGLEQGYLIREGVDLHIGMVLETKLVRATGSTPYPMIPIRILRSENRLPCPLRLRRFRGDLRRWRMVRPAPRPAS